ncbi:hypothetical protein HID58_028204 [Brassica napus]|uniref:Uncharacterized protein n=1 Tax=Brassica napus TaxID=3708 RepID=A0ABQ7XGB5_BRANA|nr:hypothetical protein HID58_028204 [Brassica napus]
MATLIYQNAITHNNFRFPSFICRSMTKMTPDNVSVDVLRRRSGNYQPSPWDHSYLLSINNKYAKEEKVIARDLLKEKVRKMLGAETKSRREQLELIDDLQKLGISYHFEVEINNILMDFHHKNGRGVWKCDKEEDLHATSLEFRLLRQHGFHVSEDIFDVIIDKIESETFKSDDINSIISLYEASYLSTKSDIKLREVIRPFAKKQIRKFVDGETCNLEVREKAIHALEMPYHWRMRRLETRWYLDSYDNKHDTNLVLIEFAKLDFNIVQIAHQEDLKYVSSWDVNRLDELPEYMRLCFLILFNEINSIGCDIFKYKNIDVIPFLRKSWADLCNTYLVEAKWYKKGYKPGVEEYMQNAWISISAPTILIHFYCIFSDKISVQILETLSQHRQEIVRCSATILRLANDLGTSRDELARGDVLKSAQCYTHETGASEEEAHAHVQQMICDTWDEINYETKMARTYSLLSRGFVEAAVNLARMSQCMYQYGDGHGCPDKAKTVERVMSLLVNPVPLSLFSSIETTNPSLSEPPSGKLDNSSLNLPRASWIDNPTRPMANLIDQSNSLFGDRRSGNYKPSPWDHRYLLSINNEHAKEEKVIARDLLKEKVRKMLDVETKSRLEQLELIDELQKLGVSYHFEVEINDILMDFHHQNGRSILKCVKEEDLHATALEFRLLRQHGFDVSEDIFDVIIDKIESETFKSDDINSIISLYEASYLSTKSDIKLREVIRPFATEQIRKFVDGETCNLEVREKAIHALEMPYHWRMRRLETRWYIDAYEKKHDTNLVLIEFAKIDFNIVQIAHQEDLKYASRIVENYFVAVGIIYEPQFGNARRIISIVNALVTTIDDIYDIYGTLEELEIFTAMVDNWDVNRLDELPEYMRLCFLILYNEVNSIGCDILKDKHINWADLCKTYLVEAKWYKKGYKPTVKEYIQNAWISISGQTILIHFYCGFSDQISVQILETLAQHRQDIVRCSATILRLANDLATSPDELARGDVLKSVQCYMHETGATEEEAQAHVQQMICDTWEEMNYEAKMAGTSSLPRGFVEAAMNVARMAQCIYQYGDGHGCPEEGKTVERFMYLVVNPVTNTKVISLLS